MTPFTASQERVDHGLVVTYGSTDPLEALSLHGRRCALLDARLAGVAAPDARLASVVAAPVTTLVVDFGAFSTGAAVVVGDQATLVRDPLTGAAHWPARAAVDAVADASRPAHLSPDGPRHGLDIHPPGDLEPGSSASLSAFLDAVRAQAARSVARPIDRLTLTVPASYQVGDRRRDQLIAAGEAAGFAEVEILSSATAVLLDAQGAASFPDGSLVLVCELGQTWSTTLLRVCRHEIVPLAQESAGSGRDLDTLLLADLRAQAGGWLEPRLSPAGDEGARARHQAIEFVRQLKHAVAGQDERAEVSGQLAAGAPVYRLARARLDRLAEPGLRWIGASCRSLLARAASGWAGGSAGWNAATAGWGGTHAGSTSPYGPGHSLSPASTLADVEAVVIAGGHARLAIAEQILREELRRPMIRLDDPDLAAVRGAVRFAAVAPTRRIPAEHARWRIEPLAWDVPSGLARLERWWVGPGETYPRGAALAEVRTADERVFELIAPGPAELYRPGGRIGDVVGPTLYALTRRPASVLAGDAPGKRQELAGSGEWLFPPDGRMLVEYSRAADLVRLWSLPTDHQAPPYGVPLHEFRPDPDGPAPRRGRVFIDPAGRLALVAWDPTGAFSVWDVYTGACTTTFQVAGAPSRVLVNEREWRLSIEGEDAGSAGRYRRTVATVWDLAAGVRVEKVTDDWQRRLAGYADRSTADRFGDAAASPDGRLRALTLVGGQGPTGVCVQEAASAQEVFRAEHSPSSRIRVAFSADGQFLLANRESAHRSHVDVWEL